MGRKQALEDLSVDRVHVDPKGIGTRPQDMQGLSVPQLELWEVNEVGFGWCSIGFGLGQTAFWLFPI